MAKIIVSRLVDALVARIVSTEHPTPGLARLAMRLHAVAR